MITRDLAIFGGKSDEGGRKGQAASAATPDEIAAIGRPGIHLISGGTGVGKSNIARNMVEAYGEAHADAETHPPPELMVYTGAGGDPVWKDLEGKKRVKIFTPSQETEFIDELNRRYDRSVKSKGGGGTPPDSLIETAKASGSHLSADAALRSMKESGGSGGSGGGMDDKSTHRPSLVVIDDAGASSLFPTQMLRSPIAQAVQSHRHADISFIISSQRYHNFNPWLRFNAATASVFPPGGREEKNFLMRELPIPHPSMHRGFAVAAAKGIHHFIHVDMKNKVATHDFSGQQI